MINSRFGCIQVSLVIGCLLCGLSLRKTASGVVRIVYSGTQWERLDATCLQLECQTGQVRYGDTEAYSTLFASVASTEGRVSLLGQLRLETNLQILRELGCPAIGVGSGMLAFPIDSVQRIVKPAGIPFLCANVRMGDTKQAFEAYRIVDVGDEAQKTRVGVIGVISPRHAASAQVMNRGISITDPAEELSGLLPSLAGQADVIVVLAHCRRGEAGELATKVKGLDVILYAEGLGEPLASLLPVEPERVGNCYIVSAPQQPRYLVGLDLDMADDGHVRGCQARRFSAAPYAQLSAVQSLLATYHRHLKELNLLARGAEEDRYPGGGVYVGNQVCTSCHEEAAKVWETTKHAKAYEPIRKAERQHDPECARCHATAYGYISGFRSEELTPHLAGVMCEACHGPGNAHRERPELPYARARGGKVCLSCHEVSRSPDFDFADAFKKIGFCVGKPSELSGRLAFSANPDPNGFWNIYVAEVDGSGLAKVTDTSFDQRHPTWSTDGTQIACEGIDGRIRLVDLQHKTSKALEPATDIGLEGQPSFSADGNYLVHLAWRNVQTDETDLVYRNGEGRVEFVTTSPHHSEFFPAISPDGRYVVAAHCVPVDVRQGPFSVELYVGEAGEAAMRPLLQRGQIATEPAWSPDGGRIAFSSNKDGGFRIWMLNLFTGETMCLTKGQKGAQMHPTWSPDGLRLAYMSNETGVNEIWILDLTNDKTSKLEPFGRSVPCRDPAWH